MRNLEKLILTVLFGDVENIIHCTASDVYGNRNFYGNVVAAGNRNGNNDIGMGTAYSGCVMTISHRRHGQDKTVLFVSAV